MTPLKPVIAPTDSPVSLAEFKDHLNNQSTTEDADLQQKLDTATAWITGELGRPLITSTWDLCLDAWPASFEFLPFNTQSIVSVKFTDAAGVVHTVDPSTYKLGRAYDPLTGGDSDAFAGRLYLASGKSWPSESLDVGEPIVVRLVAGWKDAASVPAPIKQAILLAAKDMYRNRDATVTGDGRSMDREITLGIERLTATYRDRRD